MPNFPTITIKGKNPDSRKVVDRFLDLCLANEELTQVEVLDMLMASYTERKDVPDILKELTQKASLYEIEKQQREVLIEVNNKIRYLLKIGPDDSILIALENLLAKQKSLPANSDIFADIQEFKNKDGVLDLSQPDLLKIKEMELSVNLIDVYDYLRQAKPELRLIAAVNVCIDSVYEEIVESQKQAGA